MSTELTTSTPEVKQLSLGKIISLHLIPGILIIGFYSLIVNTVLSYGYPKILALGLTALLIIVPVQLGYILFYSKKNYGTFSIKTVIPYLQRVSIKDYIILVPLLFIWAGIIFSITKALNNFLLEGFFYWLPDWLLFNDNLEAYSQNALIATFLSCLFITGLIAPIVEELYFKGFLLPRMSWMGKYAPLVNTILFALYHFWSPWLIITRVLAIAPLAYVVKHTRNVYIGIIVHCLLNIVGDAVVILLMILK